MLHNPKKEKYMNNQSPRPIPDSNPDSEEPKPPVTKKKKQRRIGNYWALLTLVGFILGSASGYFVNDWRHTKQSPSSLAVEPHTESEMSRLAKQVNPPEGYEIKVSFGDVGPKLLEAGAIDYQVFLNVYDRAGSPLSEKQIEILTKGSQDNVLINPQNAYFLLNFFWALGLANKNTILTEGPMVVNSQGRVEGFASTGGWSIASKPINELYASEQIVTLTPQQQEHLEHVSMNVYRPCCNNSTHFPDCNHGMAMLGLLQLMASQGATEDEMFEAAKYVNAFWYPNQNMEVALFFKTSQDVDFADADPRQIVGRTFSSGSGYQVMKEWLANNGLLQQAPSGGGSCGV
jgi:hypothetical protein